MQRLLRWIFDSNCVTVLSLSKMQFFTNRGEFDFIFMIFLYRLFPSAANMIFVRFPFSGKFKLGHKYDFIFKSFLR